MIKISISELIVKVVGIILVVAGLLVILGAVGIVSGIGLAVEPVWLAALIGLALLGLGLFVLRGGSISL